jgi:anti-anti-sigma regulatory factor
MVLKIDRAADGKYLVLRVSGRIQSEHVDQLKAEMEGVTGVVLDLEDVKLVDRDAVRFLGVCEANGTELRHCSPYIREWIAKEKNAPEPKRGCE